MNRRVANAILRLRNVLSTLIECADGSRPAWWSSELESRLQGELCAAYELRVGEMDGALLLTDNAIGVVAPRGFVKWIPYSTIVDWTPPRKEPPSTMLHVRTTSGNCELRLRDGDPLRFVGFLLWLSRAE